MWVTDCHDMTLAVKVALNLNTTNQPNLTLYHTIRTLNDPEEEGFGKHPGKRRNAGNQHFSPFPTMFSSLTKKKFQFFSQFYVPVSKDLGHIVLPLSVCPSVCLHKLYRKT